MIRTDDSNMKRIAPAQHRLSVELSQLAQSLMSDLRQSSSLGGNHVKFIIIDVFNHVISIHAAWTVQLVVGWSSSWVGSAAGV